MADPGAESRGGVMRRLIAAFALLAGLACPLQAQNAGPNVTNQAQYGPPFSINNGHIVLNGASPTPDAGCGTNASTAGTDSAFVLATGTGTSPGTVCNVAFATPWNSRPSCVVSSEAGAVAILPSAPPTGRVGLISVLDSSRYYVHCIGRPGG